MFIYLIDEIRLKEVLDYDRNTGLFKWKISIGGRAVVGQVAGNLHGSGYINIRVDGVTYPAHQLAWFYVYGEWAQVDHENRIKSDNILSNLRKATTSQNMANRNVFTNNELGVKGVRFHKGSFEARIQVDKKSIYLGTHRTLEQAAKAYRDAAKLHFREFANVSSCTKTRV